MQLTLDPDAQKAAFDALQALGPEVRGVGRGDRAQDRQDAGDGVAAHLQPQQPRLARLRRRRRPLPAARRPRQRAAGEPRHPEAAVPRVDLQGGHRRRGDRVAALRLRRRPGAGRRHLPAAADQRRLRRGRQRGPRLRLGPDPVPAGDGELLQHDLRAAGPRGRRRGHAAAGRGVRLQLRLPRGPRPAGALGLPGRPRPALARPVRLRPARRAGHAAADGDGGGGDRQRGRRHEALPRRLGAVGRLRRRREDRPRGVPARDRARDRRPPHRAARLHRRQRHGLAGGHPRRRRGRQDRHRPARRAGQAALRLVRLLRPRRGLRGGGGRHDRGGAAGRRSPAARWAGRSPRP